MVLDEDKLINDFILLVNSPLPDLKMALFHKVEQMKHEFKEPLTDFNQILQLLDQPAPHELTNLSNQIKKEENQTLHFEIKGSKNNWNVSVPNMENLDTSSVIPDQLLNRILRQPIEPGVIRMETVSLEGKTVGITYEKHSQNYYTGTITEKRIGNESPGSSINLEKGPDNASSRDEKKESLKAFLYYLMNYDSFYKHILKEFNIKWRPLLDQQIIKKNSTYS